MNLGCATDVCLMDSNVYIKHGDKRLVLLLLTVLLIIIIILTMLVYILERYRMSFVHIQHKDIGY